MDGEIEPEFAQTKHIAEWSLYTYSARARYLIYARASAGDYLFRDESSSLSHLGEKTGKENYVAAKA